METEQITNNQIVQYDEEKIPIFDIGKQKDGKGNPIEYCFIKRDGQNIVSNPRIPLAILCDEIQKRLDLGWDINDVRLSDGNLAFMNDVQIHPEKYCRS